MSPATPVRLRVAAASTLAALAFSVLGTPVAGAESLPAPAPGAASSDMPADMHADVLADVLSAATLVTDFTGDVATRDAALSQLPEPRRAEVLHALDVLHSPVPAPDFSDPSTHIVVLGNALPEDGSVHPNLANRLAVAETLATEHPGAPVVLTGGQTEHGHVEAEAMREWLVDRGMREDRIILEDRAWSTVSNARNTYALLPKLTSLVVVTSESHLHRGVVDFTLAYGPGVTITGAASPDEPPSAAGGPDGDRLGLYQDGLMWYLLPDHVLADGLPAVLGHSPVAGGDA